MKSIVIPLNNLGTGFSDAHTMTEQFAQKALDEKEIHRLCLITEEVLSLLHSVTGELDADYWLECEEKCFTIHLRSRQRLSNTQRGALISSSSSGQNEAAKGFLGKLREIYETALSVSSDVGRYSDGSQAADLSDDVIGKTKWDKLERSVLLSLVDDVKIGIQRGLVELVVTKDFGA